MKWADGNKANEKDKAFYDVHGGPAFKKGNAPYLRATFLLPLSRENSKLYSNQ